MKLRLKRWFPSLLVKGEAGHVEVGACRLRELANIDRGSRLSIAQHWFVDGQSTSTS